MLSVEEILNPLISAFKNNYQFQRNINTVGKDIEFTGQELSKELLGCNLPIKEMLKWDELKNNKEIETFFLLAFQLGISRGFEIKNNELQDLRETNKIIMQLLHNKKGDN